MEKDSFNVFEIRNRKADERFKGGAESVGEEVLFFDTSGTILIGLIKSTDATSVTLQHENGDSQKVARELVKPLWIKKAQVKLSNAVKQSTDRGQVFTAANVPTGYIEPQADGTGKSFYELFNTQSRIQFGQLNDETAEALSPDWFKLMTLPHFVSDAESTASVNSVDKYFPIDSSSELSTIPGGKLLPLLSLNGQSKVDASTLVALKDVNMTDTGATVTITWSEKGLTPVPKFAYLVVNDQVNPQQYSAFIKL